MSEIKCPFCGDAYDSCHHAEHRRTQAEKDQALGANLRKLEAENAELRETLSKVQNFIGPAKPTCDGCAVEIAWALEAIAKAAEGIELREIIKRGGTMLGEQVLHDLCALFMASDPCPVDRKTSERIEGWLGEEAKLHGFGDWVEAFHMKNPLNAAKGCDAE
tara:strand:- start:2409 stop:2894 length:486 start_codon:yes stop_codon:yes gene_type:complete